MAMLTHGAQDDLLLATKLRVPRPPLRLVPRAHLIGRLQQAYGRPLTLIAAPAGFGKTTLLAAWLHEVPMPAAWVSLDSGDDDPPRFWSYALAALDGVHGDGGLGTIGLPLLRSPQPPPLEVVLTAAINRLAALPAETVLVLDDYHAITAAPIHASLTFLLDHLPERLHLVIATRADPPLPLARLRARGQLVEIRAADLRFTRVEATAFLAHTGGPVLSTEEVTALDARIEGWVAGLQLAALSLHGRQDVAAFLRAFTGTHRFVIDYLTQEVLGRQPAGVQEFLLQTAILERLCGPLCEAVTGEPEGQAMLERLEAANLFLVPLDEERCWYRYHHLFAEMLRQCLRQLHPERLAPLHRRASAWYAHHDLIGDAVRHALAAADFEQAADLVEQAAEPMAKRGEIATLRAWLQALPEALVRARVELCLWHGWLLALVGRFDAAEGLLQDLESPPNSNAASAPLPSASDAVPPPWRDDAGDLGACAGRVAAIRAFIAFRRGDAPRTIALARQALELLPTQAAARGLVAWNLGIAYLWHGEFAAGAAALREAQAISQADGNSYAACMITFELAQTHVRQGQLHQADETYRQALDPVAGRDEQLAATGPLYVGRGDLQREWDHPDAASRDLREGIARCQQTGNGAILVLGYVALARVHQARGDSGGAEALIQEIARILRTRDFPPINAASLAAWHARLSLQQGDLAVADRWARDRGLRMDDALDPAREIEYLTWTRVLLAQHRPAEVAPLLGRLLRLAERQGRLGSALEILILQALTQQARGDAARAVERLAHALTLAAPEGYTRIFVDEGAPMARLLAWPRSHGFGDQHGSRHYRDHLLTLLGGAPGADALPPALRHGPHALSEPLSDRELAVLRLIVAGCSNREIADQLVVAVSTVKWYINAIYGKLQVESRTKAIVRARDLHLV